MIQENSKERLEKLEKIEKEIGECREDKELNKMEKVFKAIGSKTRLVMIKLLMEGVRCSCEIEKILGLSQSTVSHHLNILAENNIIKTERSGKWTLMSVTSGNSLNKEFFHKLLDQVLE